MGCHFNPRTPCGVRRGRHFDHYTAERFQSTHPLRGATGRDVPGSGVGALISIHAPLAGCDGLCPDLRPAELYFNPRTPCGVRPAIAGTKRSKTKYFNPRTPCGVRPPQHFLYSRVCQFQSTHPLRGATLSKFRWTKKLRFQSTHPLRGATGYT